MSFTKKVAYPFTFSVCTFSASRVTRQIKMRRIVEYPFRRRTSVRQRRISAREKVNMIKRRKSACGFPAFLLIDIGESFSFHKCLYPIKTFTLHFFGLHFFSVSCNETDKNAQSRRISVSSPYKRTAETDFGERKSEYSKTQEIRMRISCLP
jgi:hypothetical protein